MAWSETPRGRPGLIRGHLRGTVWGLLDQAVISAANFVTLVILARDLAPSSFGAFVLAYTALLFLNGIQTALVTQPHNVIGQSRSGKLYVEYTSSTAAGQAAFAAAGAVVTLVLAALAFAVGWDAAAILVAVAAALVAWQLQEFVRRVLYTEHRLGAACAIDLVSYGGQVATLLAIAAAAELSAPIALYVVAATSTASVAGGIWLIRSSLAARFRAEFLRENWSFGKWLGAALAASWLSGHFFFFLAALILSTVATGALKAAQVILGPVNAFLLFLFTVLPIRFAATREHGGDRRLASAMRLAYIASAPPVILYCVLSAFFAGPLLELFYGETYRAYEELVVLFSIYYVVLHLTYIASSALNAKRVTRPLAVGSTYAAAVAVVLGWPLLALFGVQGAVVGMILGALVLNLVYWRAYRATLSGGARAAGDEVPAVSRG